jgi:hypothetical protein
VIRFIFLLFLTISVPAVILAQIGDTLTRPVDSTPEKPDTIVKHPTSTRLPLKRHPADSSKIIISDSSTITKNSLANPLWKDTAWISVALTHSNKNIIQLAIEQNKFYSFSSPPIIITSNRKQFNGKEMLFYTLIALLLFFGLLRINFSKYLNDLFRVAFRTTVKQRQISEQLIQTPLPSLLLNIFFLLTVGLYIAFALQHYQLAANYNFWLLYFYCFISLGIIYLIKFLSLKFFGWLFNISATADGYIFIVFMINKIIGLYVLPFLVLLAFTDDIIYHVAFIASYIGIFALLSYRFILSYGLIQNEIKLNPFHFFLYLCAFEIVPLLLIYKALLLWF